MIIDVIAVFMVGIMASVMVVTVVVEVNFVAIIFVVIVASLSLSTYHYFYRFLRCDLHPQEGENHNKEKKEE